MSREFYRRDYERQRPPRRDDDGEARAERSRGTSRNRSDSRPAVSRRTTAEWQTFPSRRSSMQSEPSSDPRLRNNSTAAGFSEETVQNGILSTLSATSKPAPITTCPMALDETHETINNAHAQLGVRGPLDIASTAPESLMSPVESIASLLITFSKEAYSAAYAQLREDGANERLAKAEKIDRQNRRIASAHGDFATYTEQGEENIRRALKLLEDAKTLKQEAERTRSATAIAAAGRILELASASNVAQAHRINREQEAEKILPLEVALSTATQELSKVKQDLQQAKATLSTATQELADVRKELQQTKTGVQITSKKIEALTDSQKRDLKGVTSEVAEVRLRYDDLRTDVDNLRSESKPMLQDLKHFKSEFAEVHQRCNDLKSDFGNSREESKATLQDLKTLQAAVYNLETSQKESKATLQDLKTVQVAVSDLEKSRKESKATLQDLKILQVAVSELKTSRKESNVILEDLKTVKAAVDELSSKLSNMVQRPEIFRLSSMVDSLSQQQVSSGGLDEAQQSHLNLLESDFASLKTDTKSLKSMVVGMQSDRIFKEKFITERFHSIEKVLTQLQTDVNKQAGSKRTPEQQDTTEIPQALSSLRKDFTALKEELRTSVEVVTNVLPGLRTAIDGNKANTHSIRALTQRYNSISTEEMAQAMLRQLERLYPHASQHQASFDAVLKEINSVRVACHESHKSLDDRVNTAFAKVTQDIKGITTDAKRNDTEYREHWKRVIEDVKSQRDALKTEVSRDLKTLEEGHAAQIVGLKTRIDKVTAANEKGIMHDSISDFDEETSRIPAARNPFATNGVDYNHKRKRNVRQDSEVIFTDEREGSAPLRAKVARKG